MNAERCLCDSCRNVIKDFGHGVLCNPEWSYTKKTIKFGQSPMYVCIDYLGKERV